MVDRANAAGESDRPDKRYSRPSTAPSPARSRGRWVTCALSSRHCRSESARSCPAPQDVRVVGRLVAGARMRWPRALQAGGATAGRGHQPDHNRGWTEPECGSHPDGQSRGDVRRNRIARSAGRVAAGEKVGSRRHGIRSTPCPAGPPIDPWHGALPIVEPKGVMIEPLHVRVTGDSSLRDGVSSSPLPPRGLMMFQPAIEPLPT